MDLILGLPVILAYCLYAVLQHVYVSDSEQRNSSEVDVRLIEHARFVNEAKQGNKIPDDKRARRSVSAEL